MPRHGGEGYYGIWHMVYVIWRMLRLLLFPENKLPLVSTDLMRLPHYFGPWHFRSPSFKLRKLNRKGETGNAVKIWLW